MRPTGFPLRATLVRRALVVSVAAALAFIGLPFFATAVRAADDCVGGSIYFSPHADDDLLFMSPDLLKDIRGERCVLTVYVTTGDAGMDEWYWLGRERGEEATYAHMAGQANKWTTSSIEVAGNRVRLRTLDGDPRIRLAFMRLPDGYVLGTGSERNSYQSLERMWKGEIRTMTAVDGSASYTRESFTDALVSYLVQYQPTIVRTTDFVSSYGDGDHSDHHSVGYFVRDASQRWGGPHTLLAYQGYGIANRAANVKGVDLETKRAVFDVYAGYDGLVCTGGCLGSKEDRWLQRQYILESQPFANIARGSGVTVTASSQNASTGQLASKAIDGYALGYPTDHTHEWATVGGKAGSWIQIDFDRPTTIDEVILYDRPSTVEHITGGTLSFSDGSTVDVGPLANEGSGTSVSFRTRTVTSVRLTIDSVSSSTVNIGLTEFEVHSRTMNVARTVGPVVTASSQSVSTGQTAVKVVDGSVLGYPDDQFGEWSTVRGGAGSWIQLVWDKPVTIDEVVLFDRPNSWEWITGGTLVFSDGSTVATGSLNNTGGTSVSFPARSVTSMRFTVTSVGPESHSVGLAEIEVWGQVTVVNGVPVADAGADLDVVVGSSVVLDGSGSSDPDGDVLSYAWVQSGGPEVTLSSVSAAQPSFVAAEAGSYEFSLTVSDGTVTSVDSVTVRARSGATLLLTNYLGADGAGPGGATASPSASTTSTATPPPPSAASPTTQSPTLAPSDSPSSVAPSGAWPGGEVGTFLVREVFGYEARGFVEDPAGVEAGAIEAYSGSYGNSLFEIAVKVSEWDSSESAARAVADVAAREFLDEQLIKSGDVGSPTVVGQYLYYERDGQATLLWNDGRFMVIAEGDPYPVQEFFVGFPRQ